MSKKAELYSGHIIRNTLNIIIRNVESYNEKTEMQRAKTKLTNDLDLIRLMCEELILTIGNQYGQNTAKKADIIALKNYSIMYKRVIKETNDIQVLKGIGTDLQYYKELSWMYTDVNTTTEIDDLIDRRRHPSNELSTTDANKIMNAINISREFNIFSPRAYDGSSLRRLKSSTENKAITYGLEERDNYYNHAKKVVDRMIKGFVQGTTISNQVFDVMQYAPPCSFVAEYGATGNLLEKKEKVRLRNEIKYLKPNGLLIYTLPYTRITKDMALFFSKILKDVTIIRKDQSDYFVHVIGIKDIQSEVREDVYNKLIDIEIGKINTDIEIRYNLPSGGIVSPEYFRGSMLDEDDLLSLVNNSGLKASFVASQKITTENEGVRPLLPFNMGQIGLVLTSGCLDGTVKEYEGQHHAIKGMVTKIRNVEETVEGQDETSIETISNKVQINLLTPSGEFIELA